MSEVFPMIAAPARAVWMFWGVALLGLGLAVLFTWLAVSTGRVRFEISDQSLHIRGDLFGRSIPTRLLEIERARVLDLGVEQEYRPRWRTLGTAVPGYRAGWFRLKNGEKALVYITQERSIAYVPVRPGSPSRRVSCNTREHAAGPGSCARASP